MNTKFKNTDEIIEAILKNLPDNEEDWEISGLINKKKQIYAIGHDSKIIGRLFEIIVEDSLIKTANELGYELKEALKQTIYPDFYFLTPDNRKIAIDIKTTYRKFTKNNRVSSFGFTAGSFTSYLRNNTKNIEGNYNDYDAHYILGVLYTREENPSVGMVSIDKLPDIIPAYKKPEFFVQEKFRVCSDKKGSGNTDNIGTIKSDTMTPFIDGTGPFSFLGENAFHHYWRNHPKYKDESSVKETLFYDLPSFINWVRHTEKNIDLADTYQENYDKYLQYIK